MTWWEGIPGLDLRTLPSEPDFGNRVTALLCGSRLHPVDPRRGGVGSPPAMNSTRVFLQWLCGASDDPWDGYARRLALAIACDQPPQGTSDNQILATARELHRFLAKPQMQRP